jgi:hypothetical protein
MKVEAAFDPDFKRDLKHFSFTIHSSLKRKRNILLPALVSECNTGCNRRFVILFSSSGRK